MSCAVPSRAARLRRLAEIQAEAAGIIAGLAAEEADDGSDAVPPPPLAKPPRRRGPRLPRGVVPLTDAEREQLARAGGILGG